jgi:bacteriorhodopsin
MIQYGDVCAATCCLAGYPILFVLGTEGFFGKLTPWGSVVGHCIVDLLSKNVSVTYVELE